MRALVVLSLVASTTAAAAGDRITPLGEPDKHGATNYSVKCEGGGSRIVQCVRDDQHCGYAGEQTLAAVVEQACGAATPAADHPTGIETAPATP